MQTEVNPFIYSLLIPTLEAGAYGQNPNYYQRYPEYNQNPYGQGFGGGYQMNYPMDPNYGNYYPGFYNTPYGAPQNQYMQGQYGQMGYGNEMGGYNQMGGYARGGKIYKIY